MKRVCLFFGLVLLFCTVAPAQQRPLMAQLTSEARAIVVQRASPGRDTTLIWALTKLTFYAAYFREPTARFYLDSLDRLSRHTSWPTGRGLYQYGRATVTLLNDRNTPAALQHAVEALTLLDKTPNLKARAYAHYRVSSLLLSEAAQLAGAQKQHKLDGLSHALTVVTIGHHLQDNSLICLGLAYAANHQISLNDPKAALRYLSEAEAIVEKHSVDYFAINTVYGTLAGVYSFLSDQQHALLYSDRCLATGLAQTDYYCLASMSQFKGQMLGFFGPHPDPKAALVHLERAYGYARQFNEMRTLARIELLLYVAYKRTGQTEKALAFLERNKAHEDSLSIERVQQVYTDFDFARKETALKTLENESLQTRASRNEWIRNLLIMSGLISLGFGVYMVRTNQQLTAKNRAIKEALLTGQTLERKRVATELHDNLSAKLAAIRWRLEAISPRFGSDQEQRAFESSIDALDEVYTDVRLISQNLLSNELETRGLARTIEKLAQDLNALGRTQFQLAADDTIEPISSRLAYEMYVIILELSNNILKHAQADHALITMKRTANTMYLTVQDDGVGLQPEQNPKGIGMVSVPSRVASLNGQLRMNTDAGLTVEIVVPI
ncbi:sensor histidine kinase [Fibrella aquatilis]|uniref:histidine kinase n=1 Tax=Fibrella aquatilis TaxID=2817059 RepID=A0A939G599_9BACT|nr:histidine kinase [Fibrella aquatilis]MBO0930884.1 hypothetical protein [Fibrella aquatilis]